MSAAKRLAAPIHPGEILREEFLAPLGISTNLLSRELKVPVNRISEIVNEKRGISAGTALRLARFFQTTPQFWCNLQTAYELETAEQREGADVATVRPFQAA